MTDENRIKLGDVINKIIIEVSYSIIAFLGIFAVGFFLNSYTGTGTLSNGCMLSFVFLVILMCIPRILNMNPYFVLVINVITAVIYTAIFGAVSSYWAEPINKVSIIVVVILNVIFSVYNGFRPRTGRIKPTLILFTGLANYLVYLGLSVFKDEEITQVMDKNPLVLIVCAAFAFLLFCVVRQISEFEDGYYHSMRTSSVPIAQLRQQNYKSLILVVLIVAVALVAAYFIPIDFIGKFFKFLLSAIIYFILKNTGDNETMENIERPEFELPEEEVGNSPIWLEIILYGIGIVILVYLIVMAYKVIRNRLDRPKQEVKKYSDAVTDLIEDVNYRGPRFSRKLDFGSGYEKQIRKKFYAAVRKAIKHGANVYPSDTPFQMSVKVKETYGDDIGELTKEYENVRYK